MVGTQGQAFESLKAFLTIILKAFLTIIKATTKTEVVSTICLVPDLASTIH